MKSFSIYALKEPDTGEIRYVGKTCQRVQKRFRSHLICKQAKKQTLEQRAATALRMLGNKNALGNKSSLGFKHPAEQNERQSARMIESWEKKKEARKEALLTQLAGGK